MKKLSKQQSERLQPLILHKSARARVILYLLALGYRVPDLVSMTVKDVNSIYFPDYMQGSLGELLESVKEERLYLYPRTLRLKTCPRLSIIEHLRKQGYRDEALREIPMKQLHQYAVPDELVVHRDKLVDVAKQNLLFAYPSGKALTHSNFYRLIRDTTEKIFGYRLTQDDLYQYIEKGVKP